MSDGAVEKIVAVVDLSRYSDFGRALEQSLGPEAVRMLKLQIQSMIRAALQSIQLDFSDIPYNFTGDGAILVFDEAQQSARFGQSLHQIADAHNRERDTEISMRHFRIGIAGGPVVLEPQLASNGQIVGCDISGMAVSNAVRLEGASQTGEIVFDADTWRALPRQICNLFGKEEECSGKRNERFTIRRWRVVDPAPWATGKPEQKAAGRSGSMRNSGTEKPGADPPPSRMGRGETIRPLPPSRGDGSPDPAPASGFETRSSEIATLWLNIFKQSERNYIFSATRHPGGVLVRNAEVDLNQEQYDNLNLELRNLTDPDATGDMEAFEQFGHIIYRTVLPQDVQNVLRNHRGAIVFCTEELSLPWELLHDGNDYLCLTRPFARQPETYQLADLLFGNVQSAPSGEQPFRVLIVADPTGDLPQAAEEADAIRELFESRAAVCEVLIGPHQCTYRNILGKMTRTQYDVIHYSGHTRYMVESASSAILLAQGKLLMAADLCRNLSGNPIVFLNACHSYGLTEGTSVPQERAGPRTIRTLAQAFAHGNQSGRARAVIGSMWWIDDGVARGIAEQFYSAFLQGKSLGEALRMARTRVAESNDDPALWSSYVLFGDPWLVLTQSPKPEVDAKDTIEPIKRVTDEAGATADKPAALRAGQKSDIPGVSPGNTESGDRDAGRADASPTIHADTTASELEQQMSGLAWSDDMRVALLGSMATMYTMQWSIFSTVHILIGLTYLENGIVSRTLQGTGLDPNIARRSLRKILTRDRQSASAASIVISNNVQELFTQLKSNAATSGDDNITERHLVRTLVTLKESGAVLILKSLGVDISLLQQELDKRDPPTESEREPEPEMGPEPLPPTSVAKAVPDVDQVDDQEQPGKTVDDPGDIVQENGALERSLFDSASLASLEQGVDFAAELNWPELRSPHLFLGLMARSDSMIAARLSRRAIEPSRIVAKFKQWFLNPPNSEQMRPRLHREFLSENLLKILRTARQSAKSENADQIGEDHLLRAMLDDESGIVIKALQKLSINPIDLRV